MNQDDRQKLMFQTDSSDRRVQKTKMAIRQALLSLIHEKQDYESISVKEILERANIGRSTFYAHYQNKDEILLEGKSLIRSFMEKTQQSIPAASGKSSEKMIGFSLAWFEHIQDPRHWTLYRVLMGQKSGGIGRQFMLEILEELLSNAAKARYQNPKQDCRVPMDLLVQFLSSAFISVTTWWYGQKDPLPPKQVNAHFRALVLPMLEAHFGSQLR